MYRVLAYLLMGVQYFLQLLSWAIIINALLSWVLPPTNTFRKMLDALVNPFIWPFRQLSNRLFASSGLPIDLSPMIAYLAIQLLIYLLGLVVQTTMMVSAFY